ncbi:MAG: hypothetical protein DMF72_13700 [Acidobacteria bacterium]|nr:MAG: hypothetical protein DMF72_13700 [Acidobacteriota bacterium]
MRVSESIYEVAVIGAGVFGAWTAYQLQRSGKRVILIDAHGPANHLSSSGDQSRIIRMGYGADEIYTRSAQRSLQLWKELSAKAGENLFRPTGILWLAHEDDPYPVQSAETLNRLGIRFEELTAAEVARRYPQLGFDRISWAMFEPDSGVLTARRAVQAVVREAISNGVEYLLDSVEMPADKRDLDYVTTASGRRISAATYVFACGPWLPKMFPDLLSGRIHPTRQEVFYFESPVGDNRFAASSMPTWIDFKSEAYGLPDIDGRGVKVAIDRHGPPFDADNGDRIPTAEGLAEVRRLLALRLPDLKNAPVIEGRVCQYVDSNTGRSSASMSQRELMGAKRESNRDLVWRVNSTSREERFTDHSVCLYASIETADSERAKHASA